MFIEVLLLTAGMGVMIILGVYIHARLRKTRTMVLILVFLCSLFISMFFRFIARTSPSSDQFEMHRNFSFVFLAAAVIPLAALVIDHYIAKKKGVGLMLRPPDLSKVFDGLDDLVLIYDQDNRLAGVNKPELMDKIAPSGARDLLAICGLFSHCEAELRQELCTRLRQKAYLCELAVRLTGNDPGINISSGISDNYLDDRNYYLIQASPIFRSDQISCGVIVIFHDITREKILQAGIEANNRRLQENYDQLSEQTVTEYELRLERQKISLISSVQSELISQLQALLEQLDQYYNKEDSFNGENVDIVLPSKLRAIYSQVRKIVKDMSSGKEI